MIRDLDKHPKSLQFTSSILLQVAEKKQTLKNVTDYIADVVCKRAELGYNYGVILIPEGLIDFIPEVLSWISSEFAALPCNYSHNTL